MHATSDVEQRNPTRPQHNWLLRLFLALVVGVFAAIVIPPLLPKSDATVRTLLRVPVPTPFLGQRGELRPDPLNHQRTQIALVKSRLVLGSALRDPTVSNLEVLADKIEPIAWLEEEVQADFALAPEILRISMSGQETDDLVVLVNAIREAYKREVVDSEIGVRKQRQQFLAGLLQKYEDQLKTARETQKQVSELGGGRNATGRELVLAFIQQQLGMYQRELLGTQLELRKVRQTLDELKEKDRSFDQLALPEAAVTEALARDPEFQAVEEEIRKKETRVAQIVQVSERGDSDPEVVRLRGEISELTKKRKEINDRVRPKVILQLKERSRLDLVSQIAIQQARLASLQRTEKEFEAEVNRLRNRVLELNKQGFKLDLFQEDVSYLESMTKRLRNEHEALKVELMAPSRVSMIEEASVSRAKQTWRPYVPVLAGLAAFLFAFSCLALRVRVSLR
jgi:hypothetical protein